MSAPERPRFEPWSWGAFALAATTAGLFFFLGARPGGTGPILVYRYGLLAVGWASAVGLLLALLWSLRRRPVLQRRRAWPLAALASSLWVCSLPIAYPSSHEGKFSPTRFSLPFEGRARIRTGGEAKSQNPLLFDPSRRFGTVFAGLDGAALPVIAPAAGTLVANEVVRGGLRLVLRTGPREFCVLEGLDAGSTGVETGQEVAAGQPLGTCRGLLTLHVRDEAEEGRGEGIPVRFWGYVANGRAAESGVPVPPQEVARAEPAPSHAPGR